MTSRTRRPYGWSTTKFVRRMPMVAANRLRELRRQIESDDLPPIRRSSVEAAIEALVKVFGEEARCEDCGCLISSEKSLHKGIGSSCRRKRARSA